MIALLFGDRMGRAWYTAFSIASFLVGLASAWLVWAGIEYGVMPPFLVGVLGLMLATVFGAALVTQRLRDVSPSRNVWLMWAGYLLLSTFLGPVPGVALMIIPSGGLEK